MNIDAYNSVVTLLVFDERCRQTTRALGSGRRLVMWTGQRKSALLTKQDPQHG